MAALPDIDLGPSVNAFRAEVRDWLASGKRWEKNNDATLPYNHRTADRDFARKLGEKGWLALTWPEAWGGQERSTLEHLAFEEEMAYAGAPDGFHTVGSTMIGPTLIKCATEEQCRIFLPGIRSGEDGYGLGYSEPANGSDLAGIKTRAMLDGDHWIINGQKTFTTAAGFATHMWLAARTDPSQARHAGISMFIVRMDTPGITIHPMLSLSNHQSNTVFYDDVRVPASSLIGQPHGGWQVINTALSYERVTLASVAARLRFYFDTLLRHVNSAAMAWPAGFAGGPAYDRLAQLAAEIEAARVLAVQTALKQESGQTPLVYAALSKVFSSELIQRLSSAALELLGTGALMEEGQSGSLIDGGFEYALRDSLLYTIGGGTNEIQRNLIAIRGLGLPR